MFRRSEFTVRGGFLLDRGMVKTRPLVKLPGRASLYNKLDFNSDEAVRWLEEKTLLDAEYVAEEGMYEHVTRVEYIEDDE
jgi:hypothetical protein